MHAIKGTGARARALVKALHGCSLPLRGKATKDCHECRLWSKQTKEGDKKKKSEHVKCLETIAETAMPHSLRFAGNG